MASTMINIKTVYARGGTITPMVMTLKKGNAWRRATMKVLEDAGFTVTARGLGWAGDDLRLEAGGLGVSVEAKNTRAMDLAGWVDQAVSNAPHGWVPIVTAKRRGKADPHDGYAIMRLGDLALLLRALEEAGHER